MTRITTECPRCGRVDLSVDDVTLVVSPLQRTAWYLFDCLGCARQVVKAASAPVVTALSGLQVRVRTVPAEVLERRQEDGPPPLRVDDLLDLMLWLRTRHDLADLPVEVMPTSGPSHTTAA